VERAKIVLACLEGNRNDAVGREFGVRPNTVGLWCKRFAATGLAGLRDRARPGKTPKYGAELRRRGSAPTGIAAAQGVGQLGWGFSGGRAGCLGRCGLAPAAPGRRPIAPPALVVRQHRPAICHQACPWPEQGAADIIGLYLNPPENALVLSVDEKPTIQALERASGSVLTSSGKIVYGLKNTYKRHGTVNLAAALEVATGVIRGKTTRTKKRVDFQAFMTDLVAEQPPDREIHVILDNLSTHKKNDRWLAAHPNVTFHFTPTSASWLNQVEIWFGIFSRRALAGASFASIAQLAQAIRDFTEAYNRNAAPFVWRKREVKGAQLRNTIVNLRN